MSSTATSSSTTTSGCGRRANPEVTTYLEAENAYTDAVMKPTEPLQEALYKEMLGRIKETDLSVPVEGRRLLLLLAHRGGQAVPDLLPQEGQPRRARGGHARPQRAGARARSSSASARSRSATTATCSPTRTDTTGFREYTLHVKDLRTGRRCAETGREGRSSVAWAADNKTLFYTDDDAAKRPYRLYRHVLGRSHATTLLYEEKDELFSV